MEGVEGNIWPLSDRVGRRAPAGRRRQREPHSGLRAARRGAQLEGTPCWHEDAVCPGVRARGDSGQPRARLSPGGPGAEREVLRYACGVTGISAGPRSSRRPQKFPQPRRAPRGEWPEVGRGWTWGRRPARASAGLCSPGCLRSWTDLSPELPPMVSFIRSRVHRSTNLDGPLCPVPAALQETPSDGGNTAQQPLEITGARGIQVGRQVLKGSDICLGDPAARVEWAEVEAGRGTSRHLWDPLEQNISFPPPDLSFIPCGNSLGERLEYGGIWTSQVGHGKTQKASEQGQSCFPETGHDSKIASILPPSAQHRCRGPPGPGPAYDLQVAKPNGHCLGGQVGDGASHGDGGQQEGQREEGKEALEILWDLQVETPRQRPRWGARRETRSEKPELEADLEATGA
ncbi:hypothetical protein J1605_006460 [Eschrichtius robustus]|uniref:Uncharacterized protein n=1 Tax=Eschrichtius robustus TaxID=9764 RepID=A0AB34H6C8_ESCRO|nr:hypothetical protein J1605_006460 [Eschrichtius robustus]